MKRWITGMLAISMLLLPGCQDKQQDPTENTFTAPVLTAEDCLRDRQTLSYEEFFGEDRAYSGGGAHWLIPEGDGYFLFKANYEKYFGIIVSSKAFAATYTVPGSEKLPEGSVIHADGKWAYLKCANQLLQVDMATGETAPLIQFDELREWGFCGRDALYYAAVQDGVYGVYRLYIPTKERTTLYDKLPPDMLQSKIGFYFGDIPSTQGEVTWYTVNPEMWELVKKEIENPDSSYKADDMFADLWEPEVSLEYYNYVYVVSHLMWQMQDDTGVHALLKGIYDQKTDTYTEKTGILDGCWFNMTGHVDHYSPEITEKEPPVLDLGKWTPVPGLSPSEATEESTANVPPCDLRIFADGFSPILMCRNDNGKLTVLDEVMYPSYTMKYADNYVFTTDYIYYVSADNALIRLSYDGSIGQTLYEAKHGAIREIVFRSNQLFFVDGDTLIQLDICAAKYRAVLSYDGIVGLMLWSNGREDVLSIGAGEGMYSIGANFYLTSEKFELTTIPPGL